MIVERAMVAHPVTVGRDVLVGDLVQRLLDADQELAAVLGEGDRLEGVVGLHDVMAATLPLSVTMQGNLRSLLHEGYFDENYRPVLGQTVASIMRDDVDGVRPGDPLINAVALLVSGRRRALPVRQDGVFRGIVTRSSLLRHLKAVEKGADPEA